MQAVTLLWAIAYLEAHRHTAVSVSLCLRASMSKDVCRAKMGFQEASNSSIHAMGTGDRCQAWHTGGIHIAGTTVSSDFMQEPPRMECR